MATKIETTVTYVFDGDLFLRNQSSPISKITIHSLKNKDLFKFSQVLIFKRGFDYKVLKSRY